MSTERERDRNKKIKKEERNPSRRKMHLEDGSMEAYRKTASRCNGRLKENRRKEKKETL